MAKTLVGRLAWCLVTGAALVCSGSSAARADYDGDWWYDTLGVAQAQDQGITGVGVPVAVIDLGIDPEMAVLADARLTVREPSFCMDTQWYADWKQQAQGAPDPVPEMRAAYDGVTETTLAGTNTVAWLVGNGKAPNGNAGVSGVAPGADIRFYAVDNAAAMPGVEPRCTVVDAKAMAIVEAVDEGARIILLARATIPPSSMVAEAVAYALHEDVVVVVPVEDTVESLHTRWIGGLNGVIAVQGAAEDGRPLAAEDDPAPPSVTVTGPVSALAQGGYYAGGSWDDQVYYSGPVVAATLVSGILADAAQKWPDATNKQLIQSLIRNTGPTSHELAYNPTTGYGSANLLRMLETDPTGYDDTNPLIVPDDGQELGLTAQDIRHGDRPAWADQVPRASALPSPSPELQSQDDPWWHRASVQTGMFWLVVAAMVVLAAVAGRAVGSRRALQRK